MIAKIVHEISNVIAILKVNSDSFKFEEKADVPLTWENTLEKVERIEEAIERMNKSMKKMKKLINLINEHPDELKRLSMDEDLLEVWNKINHS